MVRHGGDLRVTDEDFELDAASIELAVAGFGVHRGICIRYDLSMSSTRITISVPEQVIAKAQRAVEAGQAESVSGYFAGLAEREPDWADARAVLDEMIAEVGGISEEDRRWARSVLGLDEGAPT